MASIDGVRLDIIGASGTQGLLGPKSGWRAYVLPQGGHAAQDSTGSLITFDSSAVAARFAANQWVQVGLNTANIRQVSAVGGNSISVSGSVTVTENDRVFLIGNTQPTVTGGSATYTVPASTIFQRDDDGSDRYTNSMMTTNADGTAQFFASPNRFDVIIQDGNQSNQGSIVDLLVGTSIGTASVFGATVTINSNLVVTGTVLVGSTGTFNGALGVTGWAFFGSTVTMHAALGVTGTGAFGSTVTFHGNIGTTGAATFGATGTFTGAIVGNAGAQLAGGLTISSGVFGATNQPRVSLYLSGNTVFTTGVSAAVRWDTEAYDITANFHAAGTTQSRITIPAGYQGTYLLIGQIVGFSMATAGGEFRAIYINKNSTITLFEMGVTHSSAGDYADLKAMTIDNASAGDFYELVLFHGHGSTMSITGGTQGKSGFKAVKLF